jgi:NAD(P)-dependent dehydrogenase (short-subunit alcohol dehydrogenase family)
MKVALITGLKKEFDKKLAAAFAQSGYKVFAMGEGKIDGGVVLLSQDLKEAASALQKETEFIDIYIDVTDERSPSDSHQNDDRHHSDDFDVRSGLNNDVMRNLYEANVIRPMAMLEAFLPLLEVGEGKRLCYLTSAQASINETRETIGYGYKMAKAALHNFLQITRNVLVPRGFTIRAYDPMHSEVSPEMAAEAALNYFIRRRGIERGDERRDDEDNLVFRDAYGRQHSW